MRLGFDLDGTLADLQGALAREAAALFPEIDPASLPRSTSPTGDRPASEEASDQTGLSLSSLTASQQRELWDVVCTRANFWETLNEIEPGALARLYSLSSLRRWDVIFLTSRPETSGDSAQQQSHRWLMANGFLTPSVFVVHSSRGKIANALELDMLVDDRPENCLDVAMDSKARPVLVWRDDEGRVPGSARTLGIGAVSSIAHCLDVLETIDRDGDHPGMIDRLKRLLGLKAQPTPASPPATAHPHPNRLLAQATGPRGRVR
jgi:hypothetical protein